MSRRRLEAKPRNQELIELIRSLSLDELKVLKAERERARMQAVIDHILSDPDALLESRIRSLEDEARQKPS